MDITILTIGSIFLVVVFIANLLLLFHVLGRTNKYFNYTNKKVTGLSKEVEELNKAYEKDIKEIMKNQIELLKLFRN